MLKSYSKVKNYVEIEIGLHHVLADFLLSGAMHWQKKIRKRREMVSAIQVYVTLYFWSN